LDVLEHEYTKIDLLCTAMPIRNVTLAFLRVEFSLISLMVNLALITEVCCRTHYGGGIVRPCGILRGMFRRGTVLECNVGEEMYRSCSLRSARHESGFRGAASPADVIASDSRCVFI